MRFAMTPDGTAFAIEAIELIRPDGTGSSIFLACGQIITVKQSPAVLISELHPHVLATKKLL